jgi:hypothetical protein
MAGFNKFAKKFYVLRRFNESVKEKLSPFTGSKKETLNLQTLTGKIPHGY